MTNDDYKKGWYDGWNHAKNDVKFCPPNTTPTLNRGVYNIPAKVEGGSVSTVRKNCEICGLAFYNPDGSLKTLGYVCGINKCPSKIVFT